MPAGDGVSWLPAMDENDYHTPSPALAVKRPVDVCKLHSANLTQLKSVIAVGPPLDSNLP